MFYTFQIDIFDAAFNQADTHKQKERLLRGWDAWLTARVDWANVETVVLSGMSRGGCFVSMLGDYLTLTHDLQHIKIVVETTDAVCGKHEWLMKAVDDDYTKNPYHAWFNGYALSGGWWKCFHGDMDEFADNDGTHNYFDWLKKDDGTVDDWVGTAIDGTAAVPRESICMRQSGGGDSAAVGIGRAFCDASVKGQNDGGRIPGDVVGGVTYDHTNTEQKQFDSNGNAWYTWWWVPSDHTDIGRDYNHVRYDAAFDSGARVKSPYWDDPRPSPYTGGGASGFFDLTTDHLLHARDCLDRFALRWQAGFGDCELVDPTKCSSTGIRTRKAVASHPSYYKWGENPAADPANDIVEPCEMDPSNPDEVDNICVWGPRSACSGPCLATDTRPPTTQFRTCGLGTVAGSLGHLLNHANPSLAAQAPCAFHGQKQTPTPCAGQYNALCIWSAWGSCQCMQLGGAGHQTRICNRQNPNLTMRRAALQDSKVTPPPTQSPNLTSLATLQDSKVTPPPTQSPNWTPLATLQDAKVTPPPPQVCLLPCATRGARPIDIRGSMPGENGHCPPGVSSNSPRPTTPSGYFYEDQPCTCSGDDADL
jgi:hypothetical protein